MWGLALVGTVLLGARRLPELTPFVAALYVCTGFFGHAYSIAWRARAWLWQAVTWSIAMLLHSATMAVQADHASARVVHYAGGVATRPPDPRLFVPVALSIGCVALLVLHAIWLGTGSRPAATGASASSSEAPDGASPDAEPTTEHEAADRLTEDDEADRVPAHASSMEPLG